MCEKRKNGAKYVCEVLKCIDLNKLQRSNERVSQDKESISKGIKIVSKKKVRKFVAFLTGGEDWLNVNRTADHAGSYKTLSV